ncbi:MAG: hypothetical protein JWN02_2552 [Acidobacteria bacterium]|nr:hypothetical protein [Acidobacteriota bacterium]
MNRALFGLVSGLVLGSIAVALMLPMTFPDKRTALAAAFASRFAVGFCAAGLETPLAPWLGGALVGFLISLPDAIITKAYVPVLVIGTLGGIAVATAAARWAV